MVNFQVIILKNITIIAARGFYSVQINSYFVENSQHGSKILYIGSQNLPPSSKTLPLSFLILNWPFTSATFTINCALNKVDFGQKIVSKKIFDYKIP